MVIPVEGGGFHAEILEFPGCYAQGDTLEQAYKNLADAAEAWIQSTLDQKHEIPEPTSSVGYSGKVVLRLPRSLHRQASKRAASDRTSLNSYFISAVAAKVGAEDVYSAMSRAMSRSLFQAAYVACTIANFEGPQQTKSKKLIRSLKPFVDICSTSTSAMPMLKYPGR
jgi:predicted RNase H-like HicB family nuclease